jgi:hypothetical protein
MGILTAIGIIAYRYGNNQQLKVMTNEKKLVAFTLRFSNKSVQAPSCERPRTAQ